MILAERAPCQTQGTWTAGVSFWPDEMPIGGEIAHAALIGKPGAFQGKVVLWRTTTPSQGIWVWDPAAPTGVTNVDPGRYVQNNVFCAGHSFDANGDLLLAGGDRNSCSTTEPNWSYVFDPGPASGNWTGPFGMLLPVSPPQSWGHYYPSTWPNHDGRVISIGGTTAPWNATQCGSWGPGHQDPPFYAADETQRFDNTASPPWQGSNPGAPNDTPAPGIGGTSLEFQQYPLPHLTSDGWAIASVVTGGGIVAGGQNYAPSAAVDFSAWPPQPWSQLPSVLNASGQTMNLLYPTAIQLPWDGLQTPGSDRIVVFGGADRKLAYDATGQTWGIPGSPAEQDVWELKKGNLTQPWDATAQWSRNSPWPMLPSPRVYANTVILPNLTLLFVGGSTNFFKPYEGRVVPANPTTNEEADPIPVYTPYSIDLLNPGGWTALAPHASPRLYHAIALVLPDGRVFVGGGYNDWFPTAGLPPYSDLEVFNPPYLSDSLRRPQFVGSVPATVSYGQNISVTVWIDLPGNPNGQIDFATLIRCPSVTHHFNWDQRVLKLDVDALTGTDGISFVGPPASITQGGNGEYVAPPGYYLLFLVSKPQGPNNIRVPGIARFIKVQ